MVVGGRKRRQRTEGISVTYISTETNTPIQSELWYLDIDIGVEYAETGRVRLNFEARSSPPALLPSLFPQPTRLPSLARGTQ